MNHLIVRKQNIFMIVINFFLKDRDSIYIPLELVV